MSRFNVTYGVRLHGAIGIFWSLADTVKAATAREAYAAFRDKHRERYEFGSPVSAVRIESE